MKLILSMEMTKYGNRICRLEVEGKIIKFDSVLERSRYQHLRLLEKAGEIQNLELQPEYVLQEPFRRNGKAWRAEKYFGDFRYTKEGKTVVEDAKGFRNGEYKSKLKRLLYLYGDEFTFIEVSEKQKRWCEKII